MLFQKIAILRYFRKIRKKMVVAKKIADLKPKVNILWVNTCEFLEQQQDMDSCFW